jgi:hypothetical protein
MKSLIKGYGREKRLGTAALANQLRDGSEVVRHRRRPLSTLQKNVFLLLVIVIYVTG